MKALLIGLCVIVRATLAQPLDQHIGNTLGFFVENAVTRYELTIPGVSNGSPVEAPHGLAYRLKFEKNVHERIYFTGAVLKDLSSITSTGTISLHTGIGCRFTASSTESVNDKTYFKYISNFSVGYLFLSAQGNNRSVLLHGVDFSLDRYQWKISRYILLDVGLSLIPWPHITAANGAVSSESNSFLYKVRYSIGLSFSEKISALFVHETFTSLSERNGVENFHAAFNGVALRVLL